MRFGPPLQVITQLFATASEPSNILKLHLLYYEVKLSIKLKAITEPIHMGQYLTLGKL